MLTLARYIAFYSNFLYLFILTLLKDFKYQDMGITSAEQRMIYIEFARKYDISHLTGTKVFQKIVYN